MVAKAKESITQIPVQLPKKDAANFKSQAATIKYLLSNIKVLRNQTSCLPLLPTPVHLRRFLSFHAPPPFTSCPLCRFLTVMIGFPPWKPRRRRRTHHFAPADSYSRTTQPEAKTTRTVTTTRGRKSVGKGEGKGERTRTHITNASGHAKKTRGSRANGKCETQRRNSDRSNQAENRTHPIKRRRKSLRRRGKGKDRARNFRRRDTRN